MPELLILVAVVALAVPVTVALVVEHEGVPDRALVAEEPAVQLVTIPAAPRDVGCDGLPMAECDDVLRRRAAGELGPATGAALPSLDVEPWYSRDWFDDARDERLFVRLMTVRPVDLGLGELGMRHAVLSRSPLPATMSSLPYDLPPAATVRVFAHYPVSDGIVGVVVAKVNYAVYADPAESRRHVLGDLVIPLAERPRVGDAARCGDAEGESPRYACVAAVGRVSVTVNVREPALAPGLLASSVAFAQRVVDAEPR
jgi:hypothetical protein